MAAKPPGSFFKATSVLIALGVLVVALLVTGATSLFGTKVGPLFGMSADALAGDPVVKVKRLDAGVAVATVPDAATEADGGSTMSAVFPPRRAPLGASKAFGPFQERDFGSLLGIPGDGGTAPGTGGLGERVRREDAGKQ